VFYLADKTYHLRMNATKSLLRSFKSSPEEKQDGDEQMGQYHLCVEEIKNEGNVLGSLELHEEAMRRLNQRLCKVPLCRSNEEGQRDRVARRPRFVPPRNEFARSIIDIGLKVAGKHGHVESDPSKKKMAGRRLSTFKPVEYDESVTAAQVLQDLDLSESEDEGVDPSTHSMSDGGGSIGGRRGSFLQRSSSGIGKPLGTAVGQFSKRMSLDLYDSHDESVGPPTHSPTHSPGRTEESSGNSDERRGSLLRRSISSIGSSSVGRPFRVAVRRFSRRRSIDGDSHVLASEMHDDAVGRAGNDEGGKPSMMKDEKPNSSSCVLNSSSGLQTKNDAGQHAANFEEGESSEANGRKPTIIDGKKGENSNAELMASWQPMRMPIACAEQPSRTRSRMGKRRSSLLSVKERRSSAVSSSFDDSMSEGSLTSSWIGKINDGSLICSFRSRNSLTGSFVKDGDLICDWERRQSTVSESSAAQSIQEGLLNGKEVKGAPGSLICGWDQSEQTILSHSVLKNS